MNEWQWRQGGEPECQRARASAKPGLGQRQGLSEVGPMGLGWSWRFRPFPRGDWRTFPKKGQTCVVHYTGMLQNGKKFDSSRERNKPFKLQPSTFNLQIESHQRFWRGCSPDELGAEGEADLHPCCGVCSKGHPGVISPHATLIFDVELLNLEWRQEVKQGGWRCLLLTLLSLLCHWDDTSRLGLLISVLTSLPHWHYPPSLPKLLCMCSVTVDTHLCLRKLQLQIEMFHVVHFSWCM